MGRDRGSVVVERRRASPVWGLRFHLDGRRFYQRLGSEAEGMTEEQAREALENLRADLRRGLWRPPEPAPPVVMPAEIPTLHSFASRWFEQRKIEGGRHGTGLSEKSREDLEWRLTHHLLPAFRDVPLDAITVEMVDRYRASKVREGKLSPGSINKTIATLSAILETAAEYEIIARNPARGRRRRLPAPPAQRSSIDRAEHISALLDAGGQLDRDATILRGQRRAVIATLVFAGLRIGEALALCWRDVDLARGTITVRASKTAAGVRTVNMLPALRDDLGAYRARHDRDPAAFVFATRTGSPHGQTNVRKRVLAAAVTIANEHLAQAGAAPLPDRLTPHSLRRTFASLLFAIGESPPYVMGQLGHTTAGFTLAVYARQMDRRDGEPERLKALVEGSSAHEPASLVTGGPVIR